MPKILLVEDDQYVLRMYERAFRFAGYTVEVADDGGVVLSKLETMKKLPDVVVTDVRLPNVDGRELLKRMKADARFHEIPVVVMTNSIPGEEKKKLLELGADLYLTKMEHGPEEIVKKVGKVISAKPKK